MKQLPPHEQISVDADLPVVTSWLEQNPEAGATVTVDRDAFDSNLGHVLLVVQVKARASLERARQELTAAVNYPERLRVKAASRPLEDVEQVQMWLHATQPEAGGDRAGISFSYIDPAARQVVVALDREDPKYAAWLETETDGVARVMREPHAAEPL
jgi:hypothetical protein